MIDNSTFTNNLAHTEGGVISYIGFIPTITDSIFTDNYAPYGDKVSSFPSGIMINGQP